MPAVRGRKLFSDGNVDGVAVDPNNSSHVVAVTYNGQLDESLNDGCLLERLVG